MTIVPNNYAGAARLKNMYFSPMRVVGERAAELASEGHDVVLFSSGEPDFATPSPIKEATIQAIMNNKTHYAPNRGTIQMRQAISEWLKKTTGVEYSPLNEILVTAGGAEAINNSFLAVLNPGDEVIVFTPAFMNYENMISMCGAVMVEIPLQKRYGFQINIDDLKAKLTDKTRMIVLNNPCNPTGVVYDESTLEQIAQLAVEHDILVFSDEIYNCITYDGTGCKSIASFKCMKDRAIIMNGFSKAYAMTGWRLGFVASESRRISDILKIHQYTTTCVPTFIQDGVASAMNLPETLAETSKMREAFAKRRNLLMAGLDQIPGLSYTVPKGAFYIFIDVSGTGMDGDTFASRLLEEYYVACIPGSKLGAHCKDFIRISYATSEAAIKEGLKRIGAFVRAN